MLVMRCLAVIVKHTTCRAIDNGYFCLHLVSVRHEHFPVVDGESGCAGQVVNFGYGQSQLFRPFVLRAQPFNLICRNVARLTAHDWYE